MSSYLDQKVPPYLDKPSQPIKIALVSCGLGNVNRGFEVSTARLFAVLKDSKQLSVRLFTGNKYPNGQPILNFPRDFLLKTLLKPFALINKRRVWEFAYGVEQISFACFLNIELLKWKPDIVWTKEAPFAHVLLVLRNLFGQKWKIIFANGGGFQPSTYKDFDYIQHLHSKSYNDALAYGLAANKMSVLPNVFPPSANGVSRQEARHSFGFSAKDWVIISVAAWNKHHKRIDYLIEEVASIQDKNTRLLLCGHPEPDIDSLKSLAEDKLGNKVQWHTLPTQDMPRALAAADIFVLSSIDELFGSASIEAAMAGLPIVIHPHGASRILVEHGYETTDLTSTGSLANRLQELREKPTNPEELQRRATALKSSFDYTTFTDKFLAMLKGLKSNGN